MTRNDLILAFATMYGLAVVAPTLVAAAMAR